MKVKIKTIKVRSVSSLCISYLDNIKSPLPEYLPIKSKLTQIINDNFFMHSDHFLYVVYVQFISQLWCACACFTALT